MELALKIYSWGAVVLGFFTIVGGFSEVTAEEASYAFLGGLLFGAQGILTLSYINSKKEVK